MHSAAPRYTSPHRGPPPRLKQILQTLTCADPSKRKLACDALPGTSRRTEIWPALRPARPLLLAIGARTSPDFSTRQKLVITLAHGGREAADQIYVRSGCSHAPWLHTSASAQETDALSQRAIRPSRTWRISIARVCCSLGCSADFQRKRASHTTRSPETARTIFLRS